MARGVTKCNRCGVEVGRDAVVIEQRKGAVWKAAGLPSEVDLCFDCGQEQAVDLKVWLRDEDGDLDNLDDDDDEDERG
jgi:hypothetical protein